MVFGGNALFGALCAMECAMKAVVRIHVGDAFTLMVKAPEEQEIKQNCRNSASQVREFASLCLRCPGIDCDPRRKPGKDLQPSWPSSEVREIHDRPARARSDCGSKRITEVELSGSGYDDGHKAGFRVQCANWKRCANADIVN